MQPKSRYHPETLRVLDSVQASNPPIHRARDMRDAAGAHNDFLHLTPTRFISLPTPCCDGEVFNSVRFLLRLHNVCY